MKFDGSASKDASGCGVERDGTVTSSISRAAGAHEHSDVSVVINHLRSSAHPALQRFLGREVGESLLAPMIRSLELLDLAAPGGVTRPCDPPQGGSIDSHGTVSLQPFAANGEINAKSLKAAIFWPFLRNQLPLSDFEGIANFSTRFTLSSQGKNTLEGLAFDLSDVRVKRLGDAQPLLSLKRASAEGGQLDLAQRTIVLPKLELHDAAIAATAKPILSLGAAEISNGQIDFARARVGAQEVKVNGGRAELVQGKDGRIELAALLAHGSEATNGASAPGPAWHYQIARAQIEAFDVALADRELNPPLAYDVRVQSATLRNIANDAGPLAFDAALSAQKGGRFNASGTFASPALKLARN